MKLFRFPLLAVALSAVLFVGCKDDDDDDPQDENNAVPVCEIDATATMELNLTWGRSGDFDLSLETPTGFEFAQNDILIGTGPETIVLTSPLDSGTYEIEIDYFGPTDLFLGNVEWALCVKTPTFEQTRTGELDPINLSQKSILMMVDASGNITLGQ